MNESKIGRRDATRRALTVLGAVFVAPAARAACGGEVGGGGGDGQLSCTDTSGLEPAQVTTREQQAYVDHSPHADRNCANCRFYTAAGADECGSCQVVQGPIHPEGHCNLWAAQA